MVDYQRSSRENIEGSRYFVIDGGRQAPCGNAAYRVLCINVEEGLKTLQMRQVGVVAHRANPV